MEEVKPEIFKEIFKERERDKYYIKYEFGLLLVLGGSDFYSGSPALVSLAAFRTGVGMVRIFAPKRAADIIASFSPNLAAYSLEGKIFEKKHVPILLENIVSAKEVAFSNTALVLGGGLGRSLETQEAVCELLSQVDISVVVDADGIWAISKKIENFKGKNFLVTPHGYEFYVLTGEKIEKEMNLKEKAEIVKEKAKELGMTILLKGNPDIISDGEKIYLNYTGSPCMAVGGTGDTLAGICGALMARKISPLISAIAGAYLNGKAGELASKKFRDGLLATDLIEFIPEAIKSLYGE
jgi:NAD(P)H-hydrate epimerase